MVAINTSIQKLKPSATLAINQKVKALRETGKDIAHFGFGQSPFPIHSSIVNALKKEAACNHYLPTTGLPKLKAEISTFLKKYQGITVQPNAVYIGPGSKELLFQTIYILESTFLIPQGSWVSYLPQVQIKNADYAILETHFKDSFKLTAAVLKSYCEAHPGTQKTLILNSPNTPTGASYTEEELQALAEVCRTYEVIVMSDEIYSQVNFTNDHSPSIAAYYPEATIVFGGLSKVFSAGGYRLGFMALPEALHFLDNYYRSLFSETFSAVSAPVQYAAIEAYKMKPELQVYISKCAEILDKLSSYIFEKLTECDVQCTQLQGAFYMMIDFEKHREKLERSGIKNSMELADHLLEDYGVALLPSTDFYFPENRFIFRLAFVDFDGEKVYEKYMKGEALDEDFIKKDCPGMHMGIERIQHFIARL